MSSRSSTAPAASRLTAALGGFLNPLPLVGGHADPLGALNLARHWLPLADLFLDFSGFIATGAVGVTAVAAAPSDAINKTLNKAVIIGFP